MCTMVPHSVPTPLMTAKSRRRPRNHVSRRAILAVAAIFVASSPTTPTAWGFQNPLTGPTSFVARRRVVVPVPRPLSLLTSTRSERVVEGNAVAAPTETVPTTMNEAIETFFFSGDLGPLWVVLLIAGLSVWRLELLAMEIVTQSTAPVDLLKTLVENLGLFAATIGFWSLQEHFLHQRLLHSPVDWFGKRIHEEHHEKPYYHVSIEPAPMLLAWMGIAHLAFRAILPLPLALTATLAYYGAGLFYVWSHYIVHTKVRLESSFWKTVKKNHMRHHLVSDEYWFAFSLPQVDDVFRTNPRVQDVQTRLRSEKKGREDNVYVS